MRKKGLSPVVATIAIILITIGAVSFIAGFLVPYFKNQLNEGTECVNYREYFTFDDSFGFNCYQSNGNHYLTAITIRADSTSERVASSIKGFNFLFYEGGETNKIEVFEGGNPVASNKGLKLLNNNTRLLEIPEEGGVRTYVYNSTLRISRVEVFPVLKENDRQCSKSADIEIDIPCSPIGILV